MLCVVMSTDDTVLSTPAAGHMDADEIAHLQQECLTTTAEATHKFCHNLRDIGNREAFSIGAILLRPQAAYFLEQNIIAGNIGLDGS